MNTISGYKKTITSGLLLIIAAITLVTCRNQGTAALRETPTSGDIKIGADESFQPIVDAELATFTTLYKYAHITPVYKPENELVADFLNDSVKVIVSSWAPSDEQRKVLLDMQTVVRTTVVAYDALALVLNKINPDSLLTYDNVKDIMTGKITDWKQINAAGSTASLNLLIIIAINFSYSFFTCIILIGIVAGTRPDFNIILCPFSPDTKLTNPEPSPVNDSLEFIFTSLTNG